MNKPSLRIDVLTKTLFSDNSALTTDKKFTYLSADASAAASTLTVQSIVGFAVDQILCIGEIGAEDTEIIKTHASTAPTGTTVTLASSLTFAHSQDTKVYIIDYDQIEFSNASTTTGTKTTLTTIAIQADDNETQYKDTTNSTGYGFVRFKETIGNTYSGYSDPVPYTGYEDKTVYAIKKRALESVGEKIGDVITQEFLDECLWQGRREYHNSVGKRPYRMLFNHINDTVVAGAYKTTIPSDLDTPYSAKNIFGLRIGTENNMTYYDKKDWDIDYQGTKHTTLSVNYGTADTYIILTNSKDFESSGSLNIGSDTIEYSANDVTNGSMTIDTTGDEAHTSGVDVWQDESMGLPTKFTVFTDADGTNNIFFNYPIDDDYENQNIYLDYYRTVLSTDSDADELDEPEFDMFTNYLAWRIKKKKNQGLQALEDNDYKLWILKRASALRNETLGQDIDIIPDIGHLPIPED